MDISLRRTADTGEHCRMRDCPHGESCTKESHGEHQVIRSNFGLSVPGANLDNHCEDSVIWTMLRSEERVMEILERGCRCVKERQIRAMESRILRSLDTMKHPVISSLVSASSDYLSAHVGTAGFGDSIENISALKYLAIIERRAQYMSDNEKDVIEEMFSRPNYRNESPKILAPIAALATELLRFTSYRGQPPAWLIEERD